MQAREQSSEILEELAKLNPEEIQDNRIAKVGDYGYIGTISIPNLDLVLPVIDSFDYAKLEKAPCLYYGSLETDDAVICAHSYKSHFGNLNQLEPKDTIWITDISGKKIEYEVVLVEELKQTNIKMMLDNMFDLTLFTCTKDGNNRVTIRCNRVK